MTIFSSTAFLTLPCSHAGIGQYHTGNIRYKGEIRTSELCQLANACTEHGFVIFFFSILFVGVWMMANYTHSFNSPKNCWEFHYDEAQTFKRSRGTAEPNKEKQWEEKGRRLKNALIKRHIITIDDEFQDAFSIVPDGQPDDTRENQLQVAQRARVEMKKEMERTSTAQWRVDINADNIVDYSQNDSQRLDDRSLSFADAASDPNDATDNSHFDDADDFEGVELSSLDWGPPVERRW